MNLSLRKCNGTILSTYPEKSGAIHFVYVPMIRTKPIKSGATQRTKNRTKRPNPSPSPPISSAMIVFFKRHPVNKTIRSAESGANIGPASPVSIKSKKAGENNETSPSAVIAPPVTQAAFFFVILKRSATKATDGSKSETDDVIAAKNAKKKKAAPIYQNSAKAVGSVWKKMPAPALKSRLLAKTIGKIARYGNLGRDFGKVWRKHKANRL